MPLARVRFKYRRACPVCAVVSQLPLGACCAGPAASTGASTIDIVTVPLVTPGTDTGRLKVIACAPLATSAAADASDSTFSDESAALPGVFTPRSRMSPKVNCNDGSAACFIASKLVAAATLAASPCAFSRSASACNRFATVTPVFSMSVVDPASRPSCVHSLPKVTSADDSPVYETAERLTLPPRNPPSTGFNSDALEL